MAATGSSVSNIAVFVTADKLGALIIGNCQVPNDNVCKLL